MVLSLVLNEAVADRRIGHNPCHGIHVKAGPRAERPTATPAQVRQIAARITRPVDQALVITAAYSVPVMWYSRLVAHVSSMKGWRIIPSHFANQDLADVWLDQ